VEIKNDSGTSHLVVADDTGLVISLTTTVGLLFGSKIIVPEYGFVLNDSMDDFSVAGKSNAFGYAPSPANFGEPCWRADVCI
jgi:gamma-glutamyltranspeptidase/glutathione hydrolase